MPLQRPRRIFRGSFLRLPAFLDPGAGLRSTVIVGLAGAAAVGGVMLFGLPTDLFGRVPPPPVLVSAEATLVAVVDGGTLLVRDTVVRLDGMTAPARGRTCTDGTGAGYDCGAAASAALAQLVRGHTVACRLSGRDRDGLAQGVCEAAGTELNRALVAAGWARADQPALQASEASARAGRLGLWRNGANPSF